MTSTRKTAFLLLPFLYMMLLALFLAFAAVWVCDGYYPVGWGWKGTGLHVAFWALPLCIVAGSFMASFAMNRRIAAALLLMGSLPFVAAIFWLEFESAISKSHAANATWIHSLRLSIAILALIAVGILISQSPRLEAAKP